MGKYSHLKDSLTKFSGEPDYQDRVNSEKERIKKLLSHDATPKLTDFAAVIITAKLEKKRLEDLVKEQNLTIEAMSQILVDGLEAADYTNLKLGNGISLSIKDDLYSTVEDKQAFNSWIRSNELEDLFSVNYQTMNSMVKQRLIDGEEVPLGVKPYFKQSIVIRGIKNLEQE